MKVKLDRTFIHAGQFYGPGEVDVEDEVGKDLEQAQKRVHKHEADYRRLRFGDEQPTEPAAVGESMTYTKSVPAAPAPKAAAPAAKGVATKPEK